MGVKKVLFSSVGIVYFTGDPCTTSRIVILGQIDSPAFPRPCLPPLLLPTLLALPTSLLLWRGL